MSNVLFQRKYSLVIGRPQETSDSVEINANTKNFKTKQLTQAGVKAKTYDGANFIEITDADLRATIKYSRTSDARDSDSSKLILRGLSKQTKDFIQQGDIVLLSAGYVQDQQLPLILSGEIIVKTQQTAVAGDELTLTVAQSFTALRNISVSRSWPPADANLYRVLKDLTDLVVRSGVDFGSSKVLQSLKPVAEGIKFVGGYSVEGNIFAAISKLLSTYGWRYFFALDVMYIEPKNAPAIDEVFVLNTANLKAPPTITQKSIKKRKKETKKHQTGFEFTLLLDGRVKLASRIRLEQGDFMGDYTITSLEHNLDYEGSDWDTKVLCQREAN